MPSKMSAAIFVATLFGSSLGVSAAVTRKGEPQVKPALVPESHGSFFGKDYPHDIQPNAKKLAKDFTHPYPEMQDDSTYDKDYVKDENNDNGEWEAQTHYDHLRTEVQRRKAERERSKKYRDELKEKLAKAKEDEAAAAAAAGKEDGELTDLEKKQQEEAEARKKAEEAAEAARKAKEEADAKNGDKSGKSGGSDASKEEAGDEVDSSEVDGASKEVEKELSDIEQCKKKLEEAQAELKRLQEERIAAEKASQMANALETDKLSAEADAKKKESDAEAALKKAKEDYEAAQAKAEAEAADLAKMKTNMDKAEDNLHKLRRTQAGSGGGVYNAPEKRSSAMKAGPLAGMFALLVASLC